MLTFFVVGLVFTKQETTQTILFALLGALLQAAFLGIVYEIWLRADVEDATLEKLGTSRDVREHGLIRLDSEANVQWQSLLDGARELVLVTARPEQTLGQFDDLVVRSAGDGALEDFRIVVPEGDWEGTREWLEAFKERWAAAAPAAAFFAIRLSEHTSYDFIATETRSILLVRRLLTEAGLETIKLLEFRKRGDSGIGAWLARQREAILRMSPQLGYSPPSATGLPEIESAPQQQMGEERLT